MTAAGTSTVQCAAGASTLPDLEAALRAAIAEARAGLTGDGGIDLALVFISAAYGPAIRPVMDGLSDLLPACALLGTTAEGVLANGAEHERGPAVAVWLARLPGATILPFALQYGQTQDGGTFLGWPRELEESWPEGAAVLLLADPFSFAVDALIARLEEDQSGVPILGGMASGGDAPGSNTLVVGSTSYDSGAVAVVIGGGVRIRPVVSQGCRPIGRPFVVTRADANVIVELGGRPALERLREIYSDLTDADRQLVRSSLHVGRAASEYRDSFQQGDFLVRNVVGADPESGVIAVGDMMRTGQTIQFHVRDAASADNDLRRLLADAGGSERAAGAIVFTCNGRGTRLFDQPDHDARCVRDCLGPIPVAGFFAQGEIGPIGRRTFLHGFTASIAVIEPA